MKTKFLQPLPLRGEQAPLIVHVARPRGPRSPLAFGEARFAHYVSVFEQGRPPIRRSASDSMAEHIQQWRRDVAEVEERIEDRARQSIWRMVRRAVWHKIKAACCCGPR